MNLSIRFNGIELGVYIDVLQGFTPFSGTNWDPEVSSNEGVVRGADFKYTAYKDKTISIPFVIKGNIGYKYDMLQKALNVDEPKELIFGNTPDRMCYAVPVNDLDFDDWECIGSGTLTFLVPDGLAHSIAEKSFQAAPGSGGVMEMRIINNGTEAVPVDYTIKHNHENGYIGIVSEHGVIQLGYVDELDKEIRKKSEIVLNYRKPSDFDAMTDGQAVLGYDYNLDGKWGALSAEGSQWLALGGVGSGPTWHGAGKMITIPSDSAGSHVSTDFYAEAGIWYQTSRHEQTGMLDLSIGDDDGRQLASLRIAKYDTSRNDACVICDVAGVERSRDSLLAGFGTNPFNDKIYIDKKGDLFTFHTGLVNRWAFRVPETAGRRAKTVSIFLGQHGTQGGGQLVARMYFKSLSFRKDNVSYWYDIPNRYAKGSVVYIDGEAKKVYVDGIPRTEDEIVGSNYPMAPPGETKVQFMYSGFSSPPPTISAKIREAYL